MFKVVKKILDIREKSIKATLINLAAKLGGVYAMGLLLALFTGLSAEGWVAVATAGASIMALIATAILIKD